MDLITDEAYRDLWLNQLKKSFILLDCIQKIQSSPKKRKSIITEYISRYESSEFKRYGNPGTLCDKHAEKVSKSVNSCLDDCKMYKKVNSKKQHKSWKTKPYKA